MIDLSLSFNEWADFWRNVIGVNVIPADTRNKRTWIKWSQYQDSPISNKQHDEWKATNGFNQGMAVICGKVWHRTDRKHLYLAAIDCDNKIAIEEVLNTNGVTGTIQELAKQHFVEQHKDNPNKAHIYFYTTRPLTKKSSDNTGNTTTGVAVDDNIPALEVKGDGKHGIMYCSPSFHKSGHQYELIGTEEPATLTAAQTSILEQHIDKVCRKYGLKYLENKHGNRSQIPITELFSETFTVSEGSNRHEALMRAMESLIVSFRGKYGEHFVKKICHVWNEEHCRPPLDNTQFEKQWNDAVKFVSKQVN
ncbi:hypothetical protein NTE_01214 [Candidatus Nitrososphaera evergladensis SR1]|uniref:DNA primase/polymerase bifunctional N-terminal domain-containing protein n=1 Tax=Candidatus Nitrososphaera evergladensis SR1 TaxID=1459636 RepID=A0A075MP36_9ARCH|nr:bifunctional DNA primase/polymerase [Candidatus Nitrososphaera evergladensis]AIF83286.1 hypothetical protein NTE_01214 [Candidatus Nitrososphaera evergladensis SR1]